MPHMSAAASAAVCLLLLGGHDSGGVGCADATEAAAEVEATLPTLTAVLAAAAEHSCDPAEAAEKKVSGGLVALGTMLVIAASFISCFGVNLQKWAHNVNEALSPSKRTSMVKNWRWWLGILAMIAGSVMDMSALPFVPMSRVAALGASTIVANIIITPLFLSEKVTKHDVFGCIVTVSGTALACYFGAGGEGDQDSKCILLFFVEPLFIAYMAGLLVILAILFYLIEGFKRMNCRCLAAGIVGGESQLPSLETVWVHDNLELVMSVPRDRYYIFVTRFGPQFYPAIHAMYAGTLGAQSVMFAKATLLFLKNAIRGVETTQSILYLFIMLVPTLFCLWNQLQFLNVALQIYCDAIFVLPVYQAMWICAGISSGLIFYQEYRNIEGLNIAMFSIGLILTLAGLGILACRKSKAQSVKLDIDLAAAGAQAGHPSGAAGGAGAGGAAEPCSGAPAVLAPQPAGLQGASHPLKDLVTGLHEAEKLVAEHLKPSPPRFAEEVLSNVDEEEEEDDSDPVKITFSPTLCPESPSSIRAADDALCCGSSRGGAGGGDGLEGAVQDAGLETEDEEDRSGSGGAHSPEAPLCGRELSALSQVTGLGNTTGSLALSAGVVSSASASPAPSR